MPEPIEIAKRVLEYYRVNCGYGVTTPDSIDCFINKAPVLAQAVQEQQAEITELRRTLDRNNKEAAKGMYLLKEEREKLRGEIEELKQESSDNYDQGIKRGYQLAREESEQGQEGGEG